MSGIVDFDQKLQAITISLGPKVASTGLSIVSHVYPNGNADNNKRIADSLRRWGKHTPGESFFGFIVDMLDKAEITGLVPQAFINCGFSSFLDFTSREKRQLLAHIQPNEICRNLHSSRWESKDSNWDNILVSSRISSEDIVNSLHDAKRIDHKYCYLTPQSVTRWYEFIKEEDYPLYEKCLNGIKIFLEGSLWSNFVASKGFGGIVILGGGAPSKDKRILLSVMRRRGENQPMSTYSIVDYSTFMVRETKQAIAPMIAGQKNAPRIIGITSDFADISLQGAEVRPSGKNVAWFILGNTLGNLDEEKFFQSIRDISEQGDLLIIGNEIISKPTCENLDAKLQKEYELPSVERFFRAPLNAWLDSQSEPTHSNGKIEEALRSKKTRIVHGCTDNFSRIKNSRTVVVDVSIDGKQINILKSTRYEYDALCRYAMHYHLEASEHNYIEDGYGIMPFIRK